MDKVINTCKLAVYDSTGVVMTALSLPNESKRIATPTANFRGELADALPESPAADLSPAGVYKETLSRFKSRTAAISRLQTFV